MKTYHKEHKILLQMLRQIGGLEVWRSVINDSDISLSECDLSSITDLSSAVTTARDRSSGDNDSMFTPRQTPATIPDILETVEFQQKNLHTIMEEKGGNTIFCIGFFC